MKNTLFLIIMILMLGFSASAQDSFFKGGDPSGYRDIDVNTSDLMLPQGGVGVRNDDQPLSAPLGSGLLILTALGGAYLLRKKE